MDLEGQAESPDGGMELANGRSIVNDNEPAPPELNQNEAMQMNEELAGAVAVESHAAMDDEETLESMPIASHQIQEAMDGAVGFEASASASASASHQEDSMDALMQAAELEPVPLNETASSHDLVPVIDDENSGSSDDSNTANPNSVGVPLSRYGVPTSEDHVQAAIRELIARGRRSEGGVAALLTRENFMQRMRRVIFSMDRGRGMLTQNNQNNNGEPDSDEDQGDDANEPVAPIEEPENPVHFDTNLPTEHSYLGANMNRVSSVNYLEVGQKYKMILFMHHHILFPGEILPFMISDSVIESDIDAHNGLLFGVCFPFVRHNVEQEEYMYGVTCQIYEKGADNRGNTLVKSSALQRFVVKSSDLTGPLQYISAHSHGKCYGYIKVLPETFLPEPLNCINMGSMHRFRGNASMQATYKRFQAATTPWPVHVYERYNVSSIVEKARTQLAQYKIDSMPSEPVSLSFWLVRNLHLSESMMKTIFTTDSVNVRMNLIASTFKEEKIFTCRYCSNSIANCRELFAMSKHGVQTQYCNSAGYIHETNTVYQVMRNAISYSGEPHTEFSWFPGYQWHIVVCKACRRQIGWEFKSIEPNLVPVRFYGISSSSVRISSPSYAQANPRTEIYNNLMRFAHREMQ